MRSLIKLLAVLASVFWLTAPAGVLAAPAIFYTDITSGPNTGGENNNGAYLTLFGRGFGVTQGTVTIGGGAIAAYKGWSDTKISVQLGPQSASGSIVITTLNGSATAPEPFTVRAGNFYFISPSGNNSNGVKNNIAQPFRNPNFVVRDMTPSIQPGDFVIVRGGTYDMDDPANNIQFSSWLRPTKNGAPGAPIAFMGYPGETVNIQMNNAYKLFGTGQGVTQWVVANFNVSVNHCQRGNVISIGAPASTASCTIPLANQDRPTFVKIVNIDIDGHDQGMLCSGDSGDNVIEIGVSDHVTLLGTSIHNSGTAGGLNEPSHLIYLAATQSDTEVGWSRINNIPHSRAVIQVHQDSFSGSCWGWKSINNVNLHDNVIHDVAGEPILLSGGVGDAVVYNNIIYNNPLPNDHRYSDVFALLGGDLNVKLYNNTVYANPNYTDAGAILALGFGSQCPKGVTLYNNIFYVTEPQDRYFTTDGGCQSVVVSDNNIWFGANTTRPSFAGANDVSVDPLFVDPSFANFRPLKSGGTVSPAIDKGKAGLPVSVVVTRDFDGNVRPQGSSIDIGAFESTGETLPAPRNVNIRKSP
jgi:hypothetical protein